MKDMASAGPHLSLSVIVKSPRLLPMLYTARELAIQQRVPERTLRDWLNMGAPHKRDYRERIGIDRNSCCELQTIK